MKQSSSRQAFYGSMIRVVLVLIALAVLRAIVGRLPMLQELRVSAVAMSGADIASVVISLVMVAVLLNLARVLRAQLPIIVSRFRQSGPLAASILHIIAILIIYNAFYWPAALLLREDFWIYRVVFLLLVCYPLYRGGRAVYEGIDELTRFFTGRIGVVTGESVECSNCGAVNEASAKFCAQCGAKLARPAHEAAPKAIMCPQCGAENRGRAQYCTTCGAELPGA